MAEEQEQWAASAEKGEKTPADSDNNSQAAKDDPPARTMGTISWILTTTAILSSIFLFALDNTITADVIPIVVKTFGGADQIAWLSVAFQVGGVSVVLPFGAFYGLFNAKWLYISSVLIFLVGSALCGAAPNMAAFIVGRTIAGLGGIGMYIGTMTLLSVNTSVTERPLYLGMVGLVFGIGNVVGPVIGGAFADSNATWRWGFYINLCLLGLALPVYLFLVPSFHPAPSRTLVSRLRQIDFTGVLLSIGFLISLVMGINFGGTLYPWRSGQIIALLVLAGVLLILFALQQAFRFLTTETTRLFPVMFLTQKEPVLLFLMTAALNAAAFVPIYYIPVYFQFTQGDSPLESGVRLLPIIILLTVAIMVNGTALSKGSPYMPWYLAGSILALIGNVLLSTVQPSTSTAHIYGYEVLVGIGCGLGGQAGFAVIQNITAPAYIPAAIGFIMIAQLLSVALALSVAGSVFVNEAAAGLSHLLPNLADDQVRAALQGLSGDLLNTLDPQLRKQAVDIIVNSLSKVYIVAYAAAALGVVASIFLSRRRMASNAAAVAG